MNNTLFKSEKIRIYFEVQGDPLAQKRHRSVKRGDYIHQYDPCADDKKTFALICREKAPSKPISGPVKVNCSFFFQRPKSHYKSNDRSRGLKATAPTFHVTKPDRDNLDKFVLDSLSGIYWVDDKQVCDGVIRKRYSDQPRTVIEVIEL